MIYAVDFDGCLCRNAYPDIGEPNVPVIEHLKALQKKGNHVILWTCRSGEHLEAAVQWCAKAGLVFDAVNDNLPMMVEAFGSNPRKVYADQYLDDKAITITFRRSARSGRGRRKKVE